jgi:hypothetical protein
VILSCAKKSDLNSKELNFVLTVLHGQVEDSKGYLLRVPGCGKRIMV